LVSDHMPRIPPLLFRTAKAIDRILPKLLPQCRDLRAAQNELQWLREHAEKVARAQRAKTKGALLRDFVQQRVRGRPLQYILGTEFFGDLELRCRPGVLIPRFATNVRRWRRRPAGRADARTDRTQRLPCNI